MRVANDGALENGFYADKQDDESGKEAVRARGTQKCRETCGHRRMGSPRLGKGGIK